MEHIKQYISEKRPNIATSSINTYSSILKNLYKKVFENNEYDLAKFDTEVDKVLEHLKDIPSNRRKTILSALVVITNNNKYRDLMLDDVKTYNKEIEMQTKTTTQKESWVECDTIRDIYNQLKNDAELLYKKKTHTPTDLQQIQQYIILSLLGGIYIPPRRSKDYCDFKIKNIDKSKDNYLDKNKLYFNSYKTAKTYGQQTLDIPIQLKNILNKWIKINPTEYLLFDSNLGKLSSVKLNQRLNKIFDKKVGINGLRKTYLTDKYAKTSEEMKKLDNDMRAMGSSSDMATTYIKLN